jgi:hypothetical protein
MVLRRLHMFVQTPILKQLTEHKKSVKTRTFQYIHKMLAPAALAIEVAVLSNGFRSCNGHLVLL